jgi:hypothetical protein
MNCSNCGATITLEDSARGGCGYCHTALPPPAAPPRFPPEPPVIPFAAPPPGAVPLAPPRADTAVLRRAVARMAGARASVTGSFFRALLLALLFATASTCVLSGVLKTDPWLGAHAELFCPYVCEDCRGPYVYLSWTTTSTGSGGNHRDSEMVVYCSSPRAPLARLTWLELFNARGVNDEFALPGGAFTLWGSTVLALWVLCLPFGILWSRSAARRARARAPALAARIAAMEQGGR